MLSTYAFSMDDVPGRCRQYQEQEYTPYNRNNAHQQSYADQKVLPFQPGVTQKIVGGVVHMYVRAVHIPNTNSQTQNPMAMEIKHNSNNTQ